MNNICSISIEPVFYQVTLGIIKILKYCDENEIWYALNNQQYKFGHFMSDIELKQCLKHCINNEKKLDTRNKIKISEITNITNNDDDDDIEMLKNNKPKNNTHFEKLRNDNIEQYLVTSLECLNVTNDPFVEDISSASGILIGICNGLERILDNLKENFVGKFFFVPFSLYTIKL